MSERWKPVNGEQYWVVALMDVGLAEWSADRVDLRRWQMGNCFETKEEAEAAAEKVQALLLSLHSEPVTNCNQLPKLTAEVFDRPDCPDWAKWAAVDPDGAACWYCNKPFVDDTDRVWRNEGRWDFIKDETQKIARCDAYNWQNSLIERPELPDWCKVGEWVYHDSDGYYYTVKSVDIENDNIQISDEESEYTYTANEIKTFFSEARLRPYNADEMRGLVGKVIKTPKDIAMVLGYSGERNKVCVATTDNYFTAETLLAVGAKLNDKPCGKLEHLDNGEWVE